MKFKKYIVKELSNWNLFELTSLISILFIIFFNASVNNDSIIAVLSATCGILYTMFAGKGKIFCYFFGILGSAFYIYLSLTNKLFGNLSLYLFYYLPMEILGIFKWKDNLKKSTLEIKKTSLSNKERLLISVIILVLIIILNYFLTCAGGKTPLLDSITTILSVAGMYLTVKRCIEQWFLWFIVNLTEVIIWINVLATGEKVYATVIMWLFYLILSVYFFIRWKKEMISDMSGNEE